MNLFKNINCQKIFYKTMFTVLFILLISGCKENHWYDFIIKDIHTNDYIICEYPKESNGEQIFLIYDNDNTNSFYSKNAIYLYNIQNINLDTYKNTKDTEVIKKGDGAIIIYNIKSNYKEYSFSELKNIQEKNGATCTEVNN